MCVTARSADRDARSGVGWDLSWVFRWVCYCLPGVSKPLDPIHEWMASLDEDAVHARMEAVMRNIEDLRREYTYLSEALALTRRWRDQQLELDAEGEIQQLPRQMLPVPEAHMQMAADIKPTGKADGILRILGDNPEHEWTTREVFEVLVALGWSPETEADFDSVAATLSRLVKDSRIHRPRRGVYRLLADEFLETR